MSAGPRAHPGYLPAIGVSLPTSAPTATGKRAWKALRPDFIFFSETTSGEVRASIVDPHGHHLGDALPKLRGLAAFAAEFDGALLRIDAISKVGDTLRVLT